MSLSHHPYLNGERLLDPWSHGSAVMRAVFSRFNWISSDLDFTHVGSLVALIGAAPASWRLLRSAWQEAYGWIRQFFVASVTIPGGDPVNSNLVKWLVSNRPRHHRSFTGRTEMRHGDATDRAASLKKTRRTVQYAPHWTSRWFFHNGRLFVATRDNFSSSAMSDPAYDGVGGEQLTVSCFGWSIEPVQKLIEVSREFADRQTQYFVIIYGRDRYGMSWQPKTRKPIRLLDTVHFDDTVKQELLGDIRKYLDPRTQRRYQSRSMPYRRGYLFYGPPGTGKSSLSTALAGEFGLDLYEVKIPSIASDSDLEQMFQEIPPQCIVLLEDIDAVWIERTSRSHSPDRRSERSSGSDRENSRSNCTLSGLLNVLDGVGSQEGRIVIMTTNKPEMLDPALVRPGRVDMKVFLGNISPASAEQMFVRMFSPDEMADSANNIPSPSQQSVGPVDMNEVRSLARDFAKAIPDNVFTPSQLQGFFQLHLDNAQDAVNGIQAWVEKEVARQGDGGFEFLENGVVKRV